MIDPAKLLKTLDEGQAAAAHPEAGAEILIPWGDLLARRGQRAEALAAYRRALEKGAAESERQRLVELYPELR